MGTMIMATITGGTKITTPTNSWLPALALFGVMLACLSFVNVAGHIAPSAALNDRIVAELAAASPNTGGERLPLLIELRNQQEKALALDPAEPFAWARLAWFRLVTQGDRPDAFAALRLSDLVSPDEPRQLPERALMWRQFAEAEDDSQKAYQNTLWEKAFRMQRDPTWALAKQSGITDDVGNALRQTDPELYEEWKARQNETAKH
jgi:hypothetical protein